MPDNKNPLKDIGDPPCNSPWDPRDNEEEEPDQEDESEEE